mgnify:FL=1
MKQLTAPELRRLIKAHNVLTKITIPKGAKKVDLLKLIEDAGFKVDHEAKKITKMRKGKQDLSDGVSINLPDAPVKATKEEKLAKKKVTAEKKAQARIKAAKELSDKAAALKKLKKVKSKKSQLTEEDKKMISEAKKNKNKKPAKKPATLLLGDKPKPPPASKVPFKKTQRKQKNKDFKEKYGMNIWDALKIGSDASPSSAELKKICRKLKVKNHPDKGGDEETFKAINEACEIYVETILKEGEAPDYEIPAALNQRQKDAVSNYIRMYSAKEIKKLNTRAKVETAYDNAQDLYNSIQQRFVGVVGFRFIKKSEMSDWFNDNMGAGKYKEYVDTEKLMKRRMNAAAKKADKANN